MAKQILLSEFQANPEPWLELLRREAQPIQLMVGDQAVAELAPPSSLVEMGKPPSLYGCMKGSMTIHGDLLAPLDVAWDALA